MAEERSPKRTIIDKPAAIRREANGNVLLVPSVDNLVSDALSVIEKEIVQFRIKSNQGKALGLKEARVLQGYIKSLVELSREARERDKDDEFENLPLDKKIETVQLMLAQLQEQKKNVGNSGS